VVLFSREIRPVPRYQLLVFILISFFLVAVLAGFILSTEMPYDYGRILFIVTLAIQIFSSIIAGIAFLFIKRRPDVFAPNGKVVERQFQSSVWARYSYNWSSNILDLAATKLIELSDLPAMDSHVRAQDAKQHFRSISPDSTVSLWRQIFWVFRWKLLFQWILVIFSAIMDSAPQFATLKLLQYLESRQKSSIVDPKAWLCVGFLLIATMAGNILDYRVNWLMWSDLGIPIRSTLTTLIFEKMMKVKDCKEPPKTAEGEKIAGGDAKKPSRDAKKATPEPPTKEAAKKEKEKQKKADQSQQDVINMFAVDTNQVGVFGAINQFYVMFASKFVVSIVFLWLLVGWESLGAGMVAIALFYPVNKWLAGRYGSYQKKLMKARDKKTKIVSEALQGIRQIKFSGMEPQWLDKINGVREEELVILWQTKLNNLYMTFGGDIAPIFLTIFALATYSYIHGDLLPSIAFTALGVFMQLEGILGMVPFLFMMSINAKVSCDRIDAYLKSPEKPENCLLGDLISFESVSVSFPSKSDLKDEDTEEENEETSMERRNRFVLRDITLEFPSNSLSVISGPTGSGKSLLLAAILGEVDLLSGNITVPRPPPADRRFDSKATAADWLIPSAIAFVSQTPWIENASIKDNILFGLPHDETRYKKVIVACALAQDLGMLDDGDLTEVGAQGISLSGGQKWRLTLARAFYSRAGILILDDVFSALDTHVGKHIYENALMGELSEGRTRILVTHHVALCLPRAEYVVRLTAEGGFEYAGLVKDARETSRFEDILKVCVYISHSSHDLTDFAKDEDVELAKEDQSKDPEESIENSEEANGTGAKKTDHTPKKLVEDEKRETGRVKRSVHTAYLGATGGIPFWAFVFVFYVIAQALTLTRSYWIKIWTSSYEHNDQVSRLAHSYGIQTTQLPVGTLGALDSFPTFNFFSRDRIPENSRYLARSLGPQTLMMLQSATTSGFSATTLPIKVEHRTLGFYLAGYIIISLLSTVLDVGRYYFVYRGSLRASRKVFQNMAFRVLQTPLRWLDTVPTGRILNRFTADFQAMDSQLSNNFAQLSSSLLAIIGIMVAASIVSPYIILLAFLLLVICGQIALRYLRGARSIKRLESIQKSPMISHFSASLEGLSTIRAFGNTEVFESRMHELIDSFTTASWHNWLFSSWVGFRMAMVGSIFSTSVAAFIVSINGVDASLAGFALAFALSYRRAVNQTLRLIASTELDMNAAERIFEYSNLEMEDQGGADTRASWPEEGDLVVKDLEVGYAEGLPSILKGLSFHAEMNQRVGIVGRTGAGKSRSQFHNFPNNPRKIHIIISTLPLPSSPKRQHLHRRHRYLQHPDPRPTHPPCNHSPRPCSLLGYHPLEPRPLRPIQRFRP
jgi:ABC-type multidrug transport system fused ATPase/permease subunit